MNLELLKNSLLVSCGTVVVAGVMGLTAALWAAVSRERSRRMLIALAMISLSLPSFLQTNCWLELLGANGAWRTWLPVNIYSLAGAIWILALMNWPIFFGFGLAAWNGIEAAHVEADPQWHGWKLARYLLWPMARSSAMQAAVLVFVLALNNFAVPALLQVKVLPAQVWIQFETNLDAAAALQAGLPLIAAPLLLLWSWRRNGPGWATEREFGAQALRRRIGPLLAALLTSLTILLLAASTALPGWRLMSAGRTWEELGSAATAVSQVIGNSFLFAAVSAFGCIVCGVLLCRWRLGWILWISFFVPGVLLGIALTGVFNRPVLDAVYRSAAIIICAWVIRYLGVAWETARQAFRTINPEMIEVARLSGASRLAIFRYVQWPLAGSKLAIGWFLIYLLCLWDVETLLLILPPGDETLAVRIFGLLHYGHNNQVNALCLLLLGLALAPLLAWCVIKFVRQLGKPASLLALCLVLPAGCTQDEPQFNSRFFRAVEVIGRRGAGAGEFNKPRSLVIDRNDNLYVVDTTGRIQKFSPDGKFLLSWQMPQTDLGKPKGMCIDGDGNIVVVEPHYQRINHFSPEGKLLLQWGQRGTNYGEFMLPRAAAVNSRGEMFIPEYKDQERIQVFSRQGRNVTAVIGSPGTADGQFNRAEGIDIDALNRIYIADSCNHRIQVFGGDGKWLRSYGQAGNNAGAMSYPYDVRVDRAGIQYVCEFGNSRVQIFDAADRSVEVLGKPGSAAGQFSNPWSLCLDSHGNLYVCDSGNHRVQKFLRK